MNTLVIVLIAAVWLLGAYLLYGRWLAKKWGVDPKAKTPAVKFNDGKDFVPTNGWTVFSHQFSSIAGAGPVTGAIQAAAFGWLFWPSAWPVLPLPRTVPPPPALRSRFSAAALPASLRCSACPFPLPPSL